MLANVIRFEFRYLLRNPLLWVTAAFTFAIFFVGISTGMELGSEGGLLQNSAIAILRSYLLTSITFMFVTTSFVANVVIRDDDTGFGPLIRSTRITKFEYLIGRFLGAFAVAGLCLLLVPLGIWLGSLMPWADPATLGPNRLIDHLYGYFLLALPNLLIHSAAFFALATITRSMMATYLGVLGFVFGFFFLQSVDRPQLQTAMALAEPFAGRALGDVARYWTVAEQNVTLPSFTGVLLYNRFLWIGIAILFLALAYAKYRFADQGMSKRERKKLALREAADASVPAVAMSLPAPQHGNRALRALLRLRTKFELKQVVLSPVFPILMGWGLFTTLISLTLQRDPDGERTYPTTLSMIPELLNGFELVPLIVAIYYAGELVWRERDRRTHEIVDASPMPTWAYVVPKTLSMALVLVCMLLTTVVASITVQLTLGYTDLELGKYLLWYVLPMAFDMLLVAALAVFIHAVSPHKAVGSGIMVLFVLWKHLNTIVNHNLLNYGGTPDAPLSDLNGAGSFWIGAWTFRLYWGAFAILLLVAAHLLWRRGTEVRLKPRLANARRRLWSARPLAGAALVTFLATGAWAFYNTNVLNDYQTQDSMARGMAEFEKRYWKYHDLPQPSIAHMTLDVALYPEERRAVAKGSYKLRNQTTQPINDVHVRVIDRDLALTSANLAGAHLTLNDGKHGYRIYHLDRPMAPGDERVFAFSALRQLRGFRNSQPETRLIENGTFLGEVQLSPRIGMSTLGLLQDRAMRRKYGLPEEAPRQAKLEDLAATARPSFGRGWATSDITVSTSVNQTPLAPGNKVSDVTRGNRRIARFVSNVPVRSRFAVLSARYAEKHRRHRGIDLAVYYHPPHSWNVDRMLDAMAASIDYYQANFGPYQFDHFRIVEFPAYHELAQAFAGTVPYSEAVGFIFDSKKPDTIDNVTHLTAHELSHQYWAQQIAAADMEGDSVLSETLAQYSADMVTRKLRGEDQIRRYLQFELDEYLDRRSENDPPLAREAGQSHITYRKGSLAMYLLQKRLGEDAVNRALRNLLARYKFKGAPYPRSLDLVAALRAEAHTPEEQTLITDLFERVTFYDLKVTAPTAARRPDGKWDVIVPIEAKKVYVANGADTETPLAERIEVGLFTAEPGRDTFAASNVILMERQPIHSGKQVLKFVTDKKPLFAGIDPYNFYIDRNSADNVLPVS